MLLFNWKKVFNFANAEPYGCYQIIKMMTYKEVPVNKYDPIYKFYGHNFHGDSFLVHPESLIYNAYKYYWREIGVYLSLASARNMADYVATGDTTMNLYKTNLGDIVLESIKDNRLLRLEDEIILHFLYEEVPDHNMEKH